jgi:hypothetical protein
MIAASTKAWYNGSKRQRRRMMGIEASRELYQTCVREMPILERLQLVRLILDDLMALV